MVIVLPVVVCIFSQYRAAYSKQLHDLTLCSAKDLASTQLTRYVPRQRGRWFNAREIGAEASSHLRPSLSSPFCVVQYRDPKAGHKDNDSGW